MEETEWIWKQENITNEEVIRESLDLLKKNAMKEQANDVFGDMQLCGWTEKRLIPCDGRNLPICRTRSM